MSVEAVPRVFSSLMSELLYVGEGFVKGKNHLGDIHIHNITLTGGLF